MSNCLSLLSLFHSYLTRKYFTGTITVNPVRYAICKRIMMFQAFCLDLIRTFSGKEKM